MICSNCGTPLASDAGFCRGCGATLRGKGASAVAIPGTPPPGAPPPAPPGATRPPPNAYPPVTTRAGDRLPVPPPPVLSEAGFWGSPAPVDGMFQLTATPTVPPPSPPGARTGYGYWGPSRAEQRARYRQRLHWLDLVEWMGAAAVLGSLFMPWYQIGMSSGGLSAILSLTPLGTGAGGWRWLILILAVAILIEGGAAVLVGSHSQGWRHGEAQAALGLVLLVLVIAAFVTTPTAFFGGYFDVPGLQRTHGPGAYLGLVASIVAGVAGVARFFVAPAPDLQ